jgi:precorrin-8X/cobalt-precorrin-8 methylmutase
LLKSLDFGIVPYTPSKCDQREHFLACRDKLDGALIVIGNAPSAALTVCRLVEHGVRPALIIGTPVGFVNTAESKEAIRELDVPSITCAGTRGGTPIAVACGNELVASVGEGGAEKVLTFYEK